MICGGLSLAGAGLKPSSRGGPSTDGGSCIHHLSVLHSPGFSALQTTPKTQNSPIPFCCVGFSVSHFCVVSTDAKLALDPGAYFTLLDWGGANTIR